MWKARPVDDLDVVYIWADGVYIKAGLEKDKSCLLVMIAALVDGSKVLLAVESGHRESTESWSSLLRSLRDRGLKCPKAVVGDGALGLWAGLRNVYPEAWELRCWNHRIMNIVDRIKKTDQAAAVALLRKIAYAKCREEAEKIAWAQNEFHNSYLANIDAWKEDPAGDDVLCITLILNDMCTTPPTLSCAACQ